MILIDNITTTPHTNREKNNQQIKRNRMQNFLTSFVEQQRNPIQYDLTGAGWNTVRFYSGFRNKPKKQLEETLYMFFYIPRF